MEQFVQEQSAIEVAPLQIVDVDHQAQAVANAGQ